MNNYWDIIWQLLGEPLEWSVMESKHQLDGFFMGQDTMTKSGPIHSCWHAAQIQLHMFGTSSCLGFWLSMEIAKLSWDSTNAIFVKSACIPPWGFIWVSELADDITSVVGKWGGHGARTKHTVAIGGVILDGLARDEADKGQLFMLARSSCLKWLCGGLPPTVRLLDDNGGM